MRWQDIKLDGEWDLHKASLKCEGEPGLRRVCRERNGWLPTRVPGEVHLDLVRAGQMDEPLVSDNVSRSRWPEKHSWWYRRNFDVSARFLKHERQELIFEGMDLYAQVFLNGQLIGSATNAFIPAALDAKSFLQEGQNELVVRLTVGSELAELKESPPPPTTELYANRNYPPRKWLRKPQFTYGWDWIEPLPNIGITREVRLEGRSHVTLCDLRLDTVVQQGAVYLETEAVVENLHPWSERSCVLELRITPPGEGAKPIVVSRDLDVPVGRTPVRELIRIPKAQLWWPNGMGDQPLYRVAARVLCDKAECDSRELNIGLRTIDIDRTRMPGGSRFCVKVNGEDVFCKGANWGPSDAILVRADKRKYETLVSEAREAHFNMFRVNGVGTYEDQAFYGACDRAGILVWQDFTFSCSPYPDHDAEFCAAVRDEAESIVASLRHHPSIALWCGTNENIWGFANWWNQNPGQEPETGGTVIYNQILPDAVRRLDPHRVYWPCSPLGGELPNDELSGDCHWWHPGFMNPEVGRRLSHEVYDECTGRFVSEFGAIGPCHIDSIRQYLRPDERETGSPTWKLHSNTFEKGTTSPAIRRHYADPENLPLHQFVIYGQMFQALILGRATEAFRFRKNDRKYECQGSLIWSYSDCWGETGWSIIDYYCRRKASYYWVRRACRPVKALVRRRGRRLVTRVVNDSRQERSASATFGWFRIDGTDRRVESRRITVPANGMVEVASERIPAVRELDPCEWVYGAVLSGKGLETDQAIWPLLPHRELVRVVPDIVTKRTSAGWEVSSSVYCHGVHFNDHGRAVLSDNYFDLLPGVPKEITHVEGKGALPPLRAIRSGSG